MINLHDLLLKLARISLLFLIIGSYNPLLALQLPPTTAEIEHENLEGSNVTSLPEPTPTYKNEKEPILTTDNKAELPLTTETHQKTSLQQNPNNQDAEMLRARVMLIALILTFTIFLVLDRRKKKLEIQKLELEVADLRRSSCIYIPSHSEITEILDELNTAKKAKGFGGSTPVAELSASMIPLISELLKLENSREAWESYSHLAETELSDATFRFLNSALTLQSK